MKTKKIVSVFLLIAIISSLSAICVSAENGVWHDIDLPQGYTYYYKEKHKIGWEVDSISLGISTTASIIATAATGPIGVVIGAATSVFGNWVGNLVVGDHLSGYYYDTVYNCDNPGIYPYIYFHHYTYYILGSDGEYHYATQKTAYEYALLPRSA